MFGNNYNTEREEKQGRGVSGGPLKAPAFLWSGRTSLIIGLLLPRDKHAATVSADRKQFGWRGSPRLCSGLKS